jgi:hypothetical protein
LIPSNSACNEFKGPKRLLQKQEMNMNSAKNQTAKSRIKKPLLIVAAAAVLVAAGYGAYSMLSSRLNPCESIFQQSAIRVQNKLESLKRKSAPLLDKTQLQKLSDQSRQSAMNSKNCCVLFHEDKISFDEFLACRDNYKSLEMAIDRVTDLVDEAQEAKQQNKAELTDYKIDRIKQTLNSLAIDTKKLQDQTTLLSQRVVGTGTKDGLLSQKTALVETEPNDAYNQANKISMGFLKGQLSEDDKEDYFRFEVPSGHILHLDFTPDEQADAISISLWNFEQDEIWNSGLVTPGKTKSTTLKMNSSSGGTYYILVFNGRGKYILELAARTQNDAGLRRDAGDILSEALEVKPGRSYTGELGGFDKEDWYRIEIPPAYILTLAFTADPQGQPMSFALRNVERNEIWSCDKLTPGVTKSRRIVMDTNAGGTYYLEAYDGGGAYQFEIFAASQSDAGSGTDAGDREAKALKIALGRPYAGELGGSDEEDWYQFEVSSGKILNLIFTPDPEASPMKFSLENVDRKEILSSGEITPGVIKSESVMMNSSSGGIIFLRTFDGSGSYQFEIHAGSQNDAGSGTDAGDRISAALEIESGHEFWGELGGLDQEDWYRFSPRTGEKIHFSCDKGSEPLKLSFLTLEQGESWYSAEVLPGAAKSFEIPNDVVPPCFIKVYEGSGKYSLEIR